MSYIIWIVVGAVLVIMAIIGYIAEHRNIKKIDKTDVSIPEVNVQKIEGGFNDMGLSTSPSDLSATNLNETNSSFSQSQPVEMATDSSNPQVDSLSKETAQSLDTSTSQLNTPTPEPIPASKQPVEPTVMPALEREVKPTLIQENMTDASDPLA
ncbi:MAG: hypothetical protein IKE75_04755, partial [Bacilli bacterium]|nr:hypothetical protein [Bacilli bacterium]